MVVITGLTVELPEVRTEAGGLASVLASNVQAPTPVEDQVSVEDLPREITVGLALRSTVGQSGWLQARVSLFIPIQSMPPPEGGGLLQVRVRVWVPLKLQEPGGALHALHGLQGLQPPSTVSPSPPSPTTTTVHGVLILQLLPSFDSAITPLTSAAELL